MTVHYITPPFTTVDIDISRDEDWYDPLPQLQDEFGVPVNFTGKTLTLYIRPTYDHSVLIRSLSNGSTGLLFDDPVNGYATINLPRASVITDLPVGTWDQFLVLSQTDIPQEREVWRGKLNVHAGRIA